MTEPPITETAKDGSDAQLGDRDLRKAQDATSKELADFAAEDARTAASPEARDE